MSVRSDQLAAGWDLVAGTSDALVYTVPSGHTTILKRITLGALVGQVDFVVYATVLGGTVSPWLATPSATAQVIDIDTWIVLEQGDELHVATVIAAGAVATWLCSGAELLGNA